MVKILWTSNRSSFGIRGYVGGDTNKRNRFVIYDSNDPCNYAHGGKVTLKDWDRDGRNITSYHNNVKAAKRAAYRRLVKYTWIAITEFSHYQDNYLECDGKYAMFIGKNYNGSGDKFAIARCGSAAVLATADTLDEAKRKAIEIYEKG